MGLREVSCLHLICCEVEGDSAVVISWGKVVSVGPWDLIPIIYEIRDLVSSLSISLSHIERSQNELADKLVNWRVDSLEAFVGNYLPEGCL